MTSMLEAFAICMCIVWGYRTGEFIALFPKIKLWHLLSWYFIVKFIMLSYAN